MGFVWENNIGGLSVWLRGAVPVCSEDVAVAVTFDAIYEDPKNCS